MHDFKKNSRPIFYKPTIVLAFSIKPLPIESESTNRVSGKELDFIYVMVLLGGPEFFHLPPGF
jgi:hypothetical protein